MWHSFYSERSFLCQTNLAKGLASLSIAILLPVTLSRATEPIGEILLFSISYHAYVCVNHVKPSGAELSCTIPTPAPAAHKLASVCITMMHHTFWPTRYQSSTTFHLPLSHTVRELMLTCTEVLHSSRTADKVPKRDGTADNDSTSVNLKTQQSHSTLVPLQYCWLAFTTLLCKLRAPSVQLHLVMSLHVAQKWHARRSKNP